MTWNTRSWDTRLANIGASLEKLVTDEVPFDVPDRLRQAIDQGKWKWSLEQMQSVPEDPSDCNDFERSLLKELERLLKSIQRVMTACEDARLQTRSFHAQANLLLAALLSRQASFFKKMEALLRRTGEIS